jgi:hypothetical protein
LFSLITGIKTIMWLIISLGLIAKLVTVSGDCEVETPQLDDFDWAKVGIFVLTCLV